MCGIFAAFSTKAIPERSINLALIRMFSRGPDGDGRWSEEGVYLGHRRLAIIDLDQRSSQPMQSMCGRYVIVFNGEIYNFKALRAELEGKGVQFRTTSDTEVLLQLFISDGADMLKKLHGMFAFIIWDCFAKRAFAARDAYGIKPLYYARIDTGAIFASQVKALIATELVSLEPDFQGQAGFWMLGSVPEPHTWYRNISAVPAGHYLWIEGGKVSAPHCWNDIGDAWRLAEVSPKISMNEIRDRVRIALRESISRHLVADVPVGVFLSGGIDSGAIAGLMKEAGARDLQGITIAYDEFLGKSEDEVPYASLVAKHYGIRHHVRRVTSEEFYSDLPLILDSMDQPSIDGINTWYASKAVSECGIKVVVSGVGGDELFFGYESFRQLPRLVKYWRLLSRVPGAMLMANMASGLRASSTLNGRWLYAPEWSKTISGAWWLRRSICSPNDLSSLLKKDIHGVNYSGFDVNDLVQRMTGPLAHDDMLALAQIESTTYLRNQLLRDGDWASMHHGVELRTPLVDSYLLAQLQPLLGSFHKFPNKRLLAEAPLNPLPERLIMRKKTGFGIPVHFWLKEIGKINQQQPNISWSQELVKAYEGIKS